MQELHTVTKNKQTNKQTKLIKQFNNTTTVHKFVIKKTGKKKEKKERKKERKKSKSISDAIYWQTQSQNERPKN